MRILIAGGGTAGHTWPLRLIAQELLTNPEAKILYLGSRQGIEKEIIQKAGDIPFKAIIVGKWRAYFSFWNLWDLIKIFLGIIQTFGVIFVFKPMVIFAKGGYVTFPIIFWAKILKIPLVIHESDSVIGRANLWAIKFAFKVCLGFPVEFYQEKLPIEKIVYTGTPVQLVSINPDLKNPRITILITGGSQGSLKINQIIEEILPWLSEKYDIYHLSGEKDYLKFAKLKNDYYHLYKFSYQVPYLIGKSEIVISRAGANSLMEIAAMSRPSIIIPLPSAAQNHQLKNALIFEKNKAGIVILEKYLTPKLLREKIENLAKDEILRQSLGQSAHYFFQKDAAQKIIKTVFQAGKHVKENQT